MWKPGFENDDILRVKKTSNWLDKADHDIALAGQFFIIYLLDIIMIAI